MSNTIYRKKLTNYWRQLYPSWTVPKGYHIHHIKPRCLGGTNDAKNLIALHPDDHESIHRCRGDKCVRGFLSIRRFGGYNPMYGKKHTDKSKKKMSEQHKNRKYSTGWNHSDKSKKIMATLQTAENNNQFVGYYNTPWGKLTTAKNNKYISHAALRKWCKNSNNTISNKSYMRSKYLQSIGTKEELVGKTFKEIGFNFEKKRNGRRT